MEYEILLFSVSFSLFVHPTLRASFETICVIVKVNEYTYVDMFEQTFP